jgi:hypothetical protein
MKVVADNPNFEHQRKEQQYRNRVDNALRELTANLLRITHGAGRPYEVFEQALRLLQACKEFREQLGHPPDPEFSQMLNTAPEFDAPEGDHARHNIVRGALQITASCLIGQRLQINAGERELNDGILELERLRAERRARLSGKRNDALEDDDPDKPETNPWDAN